MDSFVYKLVKNKQFTVVGIRGDHNSSYDNIAKKLRANYSKIKNISISNSCQVVWSTDHEKGSYETLVGFVIQSVEKQIESFEVCTIPESNYVVFEFSGKVEAFLQFLESIYTHWLPHSSYVHHPQGCTHLHFSKQHTEAFNRNILLEQHPQTWEIWIPVKEKQ